MKPTLYTAYHRPSPLLSSSSVRPIHTGRARAKVPLGEMIGDDTGDNISEGNAAWCELTALYWAWKNDTDSSHIGLMHYRRLLDLTDRAPRGPVEQKIPVLDIDDWCNETEAWLDQNLDQWDIILPRLHEMGRTVEENYRAGHAAQDWDVLRKVLRDRHPEYLDSFEAVAKSRKVRLGNIALMARPLFEAYCTWLFDILFEVEKAPLDRSAYSPTQARYIGYLAERLLTVFVYHQQRSNPDLRIREVSILNLADALVLPYLDPAFKPAPEAIQIALSTDRGYLPHAAAMLRSVFDNLASDRPIDIYFLFSGISGRDLGTLRTMVEARPHTVLHAINTGGFFDKSYRSASRAPSNATYNRFLLFKLLPGLDRLLYLDCDVIVRGDIGALYDCDMGDAHLGAVTDWIMTRTLTGPTKTIDPNVPDLGEYQRDTLGLEPHQIARYFNAGVMLFNFAAMKDIRAVGTALMEQSQERAYLFRDQDILNVWFRNDLYDLDPRWNVFNSADIAYNRVPRENFAKAMAARKDPWLIHYADRDHKPWSGHSVPWADVYWDALSRTPFFSEVIVRMGKSDTIQGITRKQGFVSVARSIAERVPMLKGPMLRVYAWLKGRNVGL